MSSYYLQRGAVLTWLTVPEIATHCNTTPARVDAMLSLLGMTESRAHATHDDGPRRYSPSIVALVRRELRSRAETCVTVRSLVQTWNPATEQPITLALVATGPLRQQDGVTFVDCTLGGISERVVDSVNPSGA